MKHKQEIYADRNALVLGFLRILKTVGVEVYWRETEEFKWPAVAALLPNGEVGWHFPMTEEATHPRYDGPVLEDHLDWIPRSDGEYTQYSRHMKNERVESFASNYDVLTKENQ